MINTLKLNDFRNFKSKEINFSNDITVIVGHNGAGKTNILESVFLLSTGKSFKAKREGEMIKYEQSITSVTGTTSNTGLEAKITTGENGWPKKRLLVNGIPRRMIDFAGNFKTVLFGPWDMDLVTESPSIRRNFLDIVLSQVDREYRRSISSYEKGIRQRNKLLWRIREEGIPRSQLLFWNQLLIKNGDYITKKREEFIEFVNNTNGLINTNEHQVSNKYKFSIGTTYQLEYDRSVISEGRLEQYAREEVASATTLVGPHRDDFVFFGDKRNLSAYGSRGEQRMGVLWLKMAELSFIEVKTDEKPTLLLDDIFSELDHDHRKIVIEIIKNRQVIITSADDHNLEGINFSKSDRLVKLA